MTELALAISLAGEPMGIEQELISSPVSNFNRITHAQMAMGKYNRMNVEKPLNRYKGTYYSIEDNND